MAHERNCIVCGKEYRYCPHCASFKGLPKWKAMFDTDVCHDVFNIVSGYNTGSISAEDAKAKLSELDLDGKTFKENVQATINKILGAPSVEKVEPVAEEAEAEAPVQEEEIETVAADPELVEDNAESEEKSESFAKSGSIASWTIRGNESGANDEANAEVFDFKPHRVRKKKEAAEEDNAEENNENNECE